VSSTAKSLGIDQLGVDERLSLIGEIWDGLSADLESRELPPELKAELDRRIEESDANPKGGVAWDEVKENTLSRLTRDR
jgi:putative addiction module component (TIGR02574 family)